MSQFDYDLFVIGAGSGGVRAGRLAAASGAKVAVAEEYRVGGTCVIRGCVPKKFMVYASEFPHSAHIAEGYGWSASGATFDWARFREAKDREIARLSGLYVANLTRSGGEILEGRAVLTGPQSLQVEGRGAVTAQRILIATGGRPWKPEDLPGADLAITSEEAFDLPTLPERIVIVGGGFIAVEFAGIFNGLGVDVTLVYRGDQVLRGFDEDIRSHVAAEIQRRGVKLILGAHPVEISGRSGDLQCHLSDGQVLAAGEVMLATGRKPHTRGLGLESAGVETGPNGEIRVDAWSKTSAASVWAVGDVTDRINLTPVAIREGAAFARTEFYGQPTRFDHEAVASAVFSQPPVGTVGLTEAEARAAYPNVDIYRSRFRPMKETFYGGQEQALVKLVVDADTQQMLGCHVVGPDAPEIIQMAAVPLKLGVTKAQWDSACAVHPTLAEELVTLSEPVPRTVA
ncbi:MAG: glutathione-disulfide reductase [Alphaproteobacteria bacterium]|jgi:glutathione reductase (NADPH)|uniref:glutathione-disulfide reductase n=1 Tax=Phenylobacterium sp. TaxID=1871053 RepID=UPI0025EDDC93|nr:glutathione-disulfide reductase [Phenylobacterium sp.]MCA6244677.1 glutathione-disulfide reductase [Phenylobacterium sp.]